MVPLGFTPTVEAVEKAVGGQRWNLILKARQLGCSTYVDLRLLAKCLCVEGTHAVVVSHEKQATYRLLRRVHFALDQMDPERKLIPRQYDNKFELTFPHTKSSIYVGTAGAKAFGRGDTITDFHGSEVGFWDNADALLAGIMGALVKDAEVWIESTANGMGGWFYDTWAEVQRYRESRKEHVWNTLFFPWTMDPTYVRPLANGVAWSPEERWLTERYGLAPEQLMWRRWKMPQYKQTETFYQEFPLSPEEAFIATGTCYFDKLSLRAYHRLVREPIGRGRVEVVGQEARFMQDVDGPLSVWEFPRKGHEYLIAADCSDGIEEEGTDSSCAVVLNRPRLAQAAVLHGKIDPLRMAQQLYALGRYYHWCWVAVEDDGPGIGCLLKLRELGYPRIYRRRSIDVDAGQERERLGWKTDARTRPLVLSTLRSVIKEQVYGVMDGGFLQEATRF